MERVDGIGGFFFSARDPERLAAWYAQRLGIDPPRRRTTTSMVEQLRRAGLEVEVDPSVYPNGRFAQLADPEGNAVQLWEGLRVPGSG